jgi:hypothetical protein
MYSLYSQILNYLESIKKDKIIKYANVWNNQLEKTQEQENHMYLFDFPAVFVEITDTDDIQQLGNDLSSQNPQIYNDITVRLHILDKKLNDNNGGMDRNIDVLKLTNKIQQAFNKKQFKGSSILMRIAERQDFEHKNIYHFEQDYICTFVEQKDIELSPVVTVNINGTYNSSN